MNCHADSPMGVQCRATLQNFDNTTSLRPLIHSNLDATSDLTLLKSIAEVSGGVYAFIPDAGMIVCKQRPAHFVRG